MRKAVLFLWIAVFFLVTMGLVLVYSASTTQRGGPIPAVRSQVIATIVGMILAFLISHIDYRKYKSRYWLWIIGVLSVLVAASALLGDKTLGSRRWLKIVGSLTIQPSEFSRIGSLIFIAGFFANIGTWSGKFVKGTILPGFLLATQLAPIIVAPDYGATLVTAMAAISIFIAAGSKKRWIFLFSAIVLIAGFLSIYYSKNQTRMDRVRAYISQLTEKNDGKQKNVKAVKKDKKFSGRNDPSYQPEQARNAFIAGGKYGSGLGASIQKYAYLPQHNSDFIFAIEGEEWGAVGTFTTIFLFLIVNICGLYISKHAFDRFGQFLALGLTTLITSEALINMCMSTGLFPTKGMALPFTSSGGSSMLASLIIIGILASIAQTTDEKNITALTDDSFHGEIEEEC